MAWIDTPHPDIEFNVSRTSLDYLVALPSGGMTQETGLIVYIHGYGSRYNDEYSTKLTQWLAETYNCVATCVDFHDASAQHQPKMRPAPDFFIKLKEHYGIEVTAPSGMDVMDIARSVLEQMAARGVQRLDESCQFYKDSDNYINFGVLPALDVIQVVWALLKEYPISKKRLFVIGTSYGGYIALMMAKMAPGTFRLVVDNSGFSSPNEDSPAIYGITKWKGHVDAVLVCPRAFNNDPRSPLYFSPSRRVIRQIGIGGHYAGKSETIIHTYHSAKDTFAITDNKIEMAKILSQFRNYDLRLIHEADIDGRIFKTMDHGMNASMRGLFDMSFRRWSSEGAAQPCTTDFDLLTVNRLPCGECDYVVSFTPEKGVHLQIEHRTAHPHLL